MQQPTNRLFNTLQSFTRYFYLEEDGPVDNILSIPIIFTLLVLFQGCFGPNGIVNPPKFITSTLHGYTISPLIRFLFVMSIAYTATQNVTYAFSGTVVFFIFLYIIRSVEEREKLSFYF